MRKHLKGFCAVLLTTAWRTSSFKCYPDQKEQLSALRQEEYEWIIGEPGQSCADACDRGVARPGDPTRHKNCNEEMISYIDTAEELLFIALDAGFACDVTDGFSWAEYPAIETSSATCSFRAPWEYVDSCAERTYPRSHRFCHCGTTWYKSALGESCDAMCGRTGMPCNESAMCDCNTVEKVKVVAELFGAPCNEEFPIWAKEFPSQLPDQSCAYTYGYTETCSSTVPPDQRRFCPCLVIKENSTTTTKNTGPPTWTTLTGTTLTGTTFSGTTLTFTTRTQPRPTTTTPVPTTPAPPTTTTPKPTTVPFSTRAPGDSTTTTTTVTVTSFTTTETTASTTSSSTTATTKTFTISTTTNTYDTKAPEVTTTTEGPGGGGDPHLRNIFGEHFEVNREGISTFLVFPPQEEGKQSGDARLRVDASIEHPGTGDICRGWFIVRLWVKGSLVGEDIAVSTGSKDLRTSKSLSVKIGKSTMMNADEVAAYDTHGRYNITLTDLRGALGPELINRRKFAKLTLDIGGAELQIAWYTGRKRPNCLYFHARGLASIGETWGGILGAADRSWMSTTDPNCRQDPHQFEGLVIAGGTGKGAAGADAAGTNPGAHFSATASLH